MASSPFYTRPAGQLSPAAGPQTPYFGHLERSNSTGSAWSLSPTDAVAHSGAPSGADDADRLRSRPPGAPGLSPSSSYAGLDPTRAYSPMGRTPSRDMQASSPLEPGSHLGTIGQGRKGSSSSVGAIGEGRGTAPSATTPATERRDEEAFLGLPTGYFNQDGSFAVPFPGSGAEGNGSDQANGGASKSRPSSFILDVLPQTRERVGGGSSGPPTPSLSLDSASQPPAMSATASEMFPLPSPHSLAPSSYLTTAPQSPFGSLPQSPGGHLFAGSSRTSSPGPIDTTPGLAPLSSVEALAGKVQTLESHVSTLSNVLATEFRSLREELGALRSLVQQQQRQQPAGNRSNVSSERTERGNSPVLTLRSPSPHSAGRTPTLPQNLVFGGGAPLNGSFNGSVSSLHVQPATSPGAVSPSSSVASGFFAGQQQAIAQDAREDPADGSSNLKDEQIKLLTAQVNSLTTTVSTLLGSPALSSNGFGGVGTASPLVGSGAPSSVPARGMTMPLGSPALGLAVPSVGTGLSARAPPPMIRTASGTGLGRNASLRSSVNGPGSGGSFDGAPMMSPSPSLSGWTEQPGGAHGPASVAMMPSASTGSASGVGSPMLGAGGSSGNPPGSLGSKWEMLGVGNDLFRAVAKFGSVLSSSSSAKLPALISDLGGPPASVRRPRSRARRFRVSSADKTSWPRPRRSRSAFNATLSRRCRLSIHTLR